jgi:hypothetical protein
MRCTRYFFRLRGDEMDKLQPPLILDDVKISRPIQGGTRPPWKVPPRYGTAPIRVKPQPPWGYDDTSFTYANGKPLATLSKQVVFLLQNSDGSVVVDYSALATSQGWRADIFITASLKYGGGTIAQYPLSVVHCFCGSQDVFATAGIDSGYFDIVDSVDLTFSTPNWARCT